MTRLLTAEEVAQMLKVPPSWVYAEARRGALPHVRLGRYVRFTEEDVQAWLQQHKVGAPRARR